MTEEEIVQQLEANTAALRELQETTLKTAKYLKWLTIMGVVKWLLILIPLIIAYFYLPSLINSLLGSYSELLPGGFNSLIK